MTDSRRALSPTVCDLADVLAEMPSSAGSTLVRDDSATSDDMLAQARRVRPVATPEEELKRIRECLGVVGYRIASRLDDHQNAHVYMARRLATGESVAIKVLVEQPLDTGSAIKRFHQEARLLASLSHPNLVKAVAHGSLWNVHYLVLELAPGINLRRKVEDEGPLSLRLATSVILQAAQALEYAHRHGVIHRDVKPSNLVLGPDGRVKLLDLGLARRPCQPQESLTMIFHDHLLGTPDFMAPEQAIDCHEVDGRADLYALGCTFYYFVAGRPPFTGRSTLERLLAHQSVPPVPLSEVRSGTPEGLSQICDRLLAKQPQNRYQKAGDLVEHLAPWLAKCSRS